MVDAILSKIPGVPSDSVVDQGRAIMEDLRRGLFLFIPMLILRQENPNNVGLTEVSDLFFWTQIIYYISYIPIQILKIDWQLDASFYVHFIITLINLIYTTPRLNDAENARDVNQYSLLVTQIYYVWLVVKLIVDVVHIAFTLIGAFADIKLLKHLVRGLDLSLLVDSIFSLYLVTLFIERIRNQANPSQCDPAFIEHTNNSLESLHIFLYSLMVAIGVDVLFYFWILSTKGSSFALPSFIVNLVAKAISAVIFIWYLINVAILVRDYNDDVPNCKSTAAQGYDLLARFVLYGVLYGFIYFAVCCALQFIHKNLAKNMKAKYFKELLVVAIID